MGVQRASRPLETAPVAELLRGFLASHVEVRLAWLFGSRGRGDETARSDVDVAVYCGGWPPSVPWGYQAHLLGELTELVGTDAVDVVVMDLAPPLLAHRVIRDGLLLVCRDEAERVRFVARTLLRYLDTRPLRELQARYLASRLTQTMTAR